MAFRNKKGELPMNLIDFHVHPYLNAGQYTNMYHALETEQERAAMGIRTRDWRRYCARRKRMVW